MRGLEGKGGGHALPYCALLCPAVPCHGAPCRLPCPAVPSQIWTHQPRLAAVKLCTNYSGGTVLVW